MQDEFTQEPRIAYFSMEIALRNDIPTYSGGLGVLAGDTVRSAADLMLPLVAVSLVSRSGYFRQEIDSQGRQIEQPDMWDPAKLATPLGAKIAVRMSGRDVWIRGWLYVLTGQTNGRVPVILLDTDLEENQHDDRELTHYLYGGDETYRLKQEIVLGIGGVRLLRALGFHIRHYHMNEGHSALLGLELLRRHAYPPEEVRPGEARFNIPRVRELCNFTTHTPVEAGHDRFSYDLVDRVLEEFIDPATLKSMAGEDALNMTRLALNVSEHINGVAKRHAELSRKMYPGYRVEAVTNGVHSFTWTHPAIAALFDRYIPGWCHEPGMLVRVNQIPDEAIWEAHCQAKAHLIETVRTHSGVVLDPNRPILGFARRMTAYKRPDLLFADLDRLKTIARQFPIQIVLAGKAHPRDGEGKRLIELLHDHIKTLSGVIPMAYLPNYNLELALAMVSGSDIWLNTPLRPLEASGTSGMKAAINGVPSLSVLDGWWLEGCIEGLTGWAIGDGEQSANDGDAASLYAKLEQTVLPLYDRDRAGWLRVMKGAIGTNGSFFTSHRMMRRYGTGPYIR
ncbi:MAG TPA: alpha-glucan family phosphorylase [Nitrospiria bacterium]|nr:alpha-glucan family phosphorylase [Nitrospiria bacterium]